MSEQSSRPSDDQGRAHGHQHFGEESPNADPNSTHVDLFSNGHMNPSPLILANGTNIAWPSGWTEAEAATWRLAHHLNHPSAVLARLVQPRLPAQEKGIDGDDDAV